jgi:hypothetical protein
VDYKLKPLLIRNGGLPFIKGENTGRVFVRQTFSADSLISIFHDLSQSDGIAKSRGNAWFYTTSCKRGIKVN